MQKFVCRSTVAESANMAQYKQNQFNQFVADNVAQNLRTLHGLNIFHVMGVIAKITPGSPRVRRNLCRAVKIDELRIISTSRSAICNRFCGFTPGDTKYLRPQVTHIPQHNRSSMESILVVTPPCHSWSDKIQAVLKGSQTGQCLLFEWLTSTLEKYHAFINTDLCYPARR